MPQILRPYQVTADKAVREAFRSGKKAVLLVLPCGAGKTTVFAHFIMGLIRKGNTAIFMVHRRELTKQARKRLAEHDVPHGCIEAGHKQDPSAPVQVASVQSLRPRLFPKDPATAQLPPPAKLLIIDEAHRSTAPSYKKIISKYPGALLLGLTATPARTDGKGLGDIYDAMVEVTSVAELIEMGFLSDYVIYEPPTRVDASSLHVDNNGEFNTAEATELVDTDKLVGEVYTNWKLRADGKQTIIFAQSEQHGKHITSVFRAAGEDFWYVDYRTPMDERDKITARFEAGQIKGIVNLSIYGEGFDVPSVECIVIARFTHSLISWVQWTMRGMRPYPGKLACVILDHGFNARDRFGGPDFPHEWSLDGRKKREDPVQPVLTTCPVCRAIVSSRTRTCPECNYVLHATAPRQAIPDTTPGMLVEGNYKIRGSEREEAAKKRAQEKLEQERRAAERAAKKQEKIDADVRKKQELEVQKKTLAELIARAADKNYSFKYPLIRFKELYGSFPNHRHGVSVKWTATGETIPGTSRMKMQITGWQWDGIKYGKA